MPKTKQKHKTIGVSFNPLLRQRALLRARKLGLCFSRYVSVCVEAELALCAQDLAVTASRSIAGGAFIAGYAGGSVGAACADTANSRDAYAGMEAGAGMRAGAGTDTRAVADVWAGAGVDTATKGSVGVCADGAAPGCGAGVLSASVGGVAAPGKGSAGSVTTTTATTTTTAAVATAATTAVGTTVVGTDAAVGATASDSAIAAEGKKVPSQVRTTDMRKQRLAVAAATVAGGFAVVRARRAVRVGGGGVDVGAVTAEASLAAAMPEKVCAQAELTQEARREGVEIRQGGAAVALAASGSATASGGTGNGAGAAVGVGVAVGAGNSSGAGAGITDDRQNLSLSAREPAWEWAEPLPVERLRRDVALLLEACGVLSVCDAPAGGGAADFMIERHCRARGCALRAAVLCHAFERDSHAVLLGNAMMLAQAQGVDAVILCVPYVSGFDTTVRAIFSNHGIRVASPDTLLQTIDDAGESL